MQRPLIAMGTRTLTFSTGGGGSFGRAEGGGVLSAT